MDQEARLISVALVRYADSCPPALHPDCPYAEEVEGGRRCERQCRDEVVRLSKPGHSGGAIFAGPLFDARQCLLSERTAVPDANWHTSSLLQRLRAAILHPPRNRRGEPFLVREIEATNALAYLGQRGFDLDWIVRFGLAQDLPTRLALWVIDSCADAESTGAGCPDWLGPWLEVFEAHGGERHEGNIGQLLANAQQSGFLSWIQRWLQQAPLPRIIGWGVVDDLDDVVVPDDGQARWMVDRLTQTYLQQWSEPSLHHEYRYLRGMQDPPVTAGEMRQRQLTEAVVDRELARRSVEGGRSRLAGVTEQAIALLGEGRRREAAALFDAARILDPHDADAHNNYGFCLTPDDPSAAHGALRQSEELGSSSPALNLLNQSVALRLLGRTEDALAAVERAHERTGGRSEHAWLWKNPTSGGEPTIEGCDLLTYIRKLGLELVVEVGDNARAEVWRERLGEADGLID